MLCRYFTTTGIKVEQAFEDADTLIVNTAIKEASSHDSVEIVGEDIDLLVLLAGLAPDKNNIFFRKPAKGNTPENLYSPHSFKHKYKMTITSFTESLNERPSSRYENNSIAIVTELDMKWNKIVLLYLKKKMIGAPPYFSLVILSRRYFDTVSAMFTGAHIKSDGKYPGPES
ncbi:unnamed protein product [Euphydryas editha]|uniref:Uncharacterized protein n=1 Tax=Euphydryas editha TaxID=104508 RepID=A0AAU9TD58_EUPED|nr:unnamed protein product [Euphydryas editha]